MKVYEMELKNFKDSEWPSETLWIATDRKIIVSEESSITDLHEIDVKVADAMGIDLIIK